MKSYPLSYDILKDDDLYLRWRDQKLSNSISRYEDFLVEIKNLSSPTKAEISAIKGKLARSNAAIYISNLKDEDPSQLIRFGLSLGLSDIDSTPESENSGVTSIKVRSKDEYSGEQYEYIPYSNLKINWHTDGYYNSKENRVLSLLLHCVRNAEEGGENDIFDHELAFIFLRDQDKVGALSLFEDDTMTIEARIENGRTIRDSISGSVFFFNENQLMMRYTHRIKTVSWKDTDYTKKISQTIRNLLDNRKSEFIFRIKLLPGEGIICNNILHTRERFKQSDSLYGGRLLYRLRYKSIIK